MRDDYRPTKNETEPKEKGNPMKGCPGAALLRAFYRTADASQVNFISGSLASTRCGFNSRATQRVIVPEATRAHCGIIAIEGISAGQR
jgi:hypothetical protein